MKLFDKEFKDWIDGHRNDDVASLRLRFASADAEVKEAISQIEYRSKAGDKFRNPVMDKDFAPQWFPTGLSVEQASSAAVAAFHASLMSGARSVLDMTMGLGVDAAAVAAIDGAEVTAVERDTRLCDFARENYKSIGNLAIVNADSVEYLNDTPQSFDWIFIDPARRDDVGRRVFNIHDCTPDVSEIMPLMFSHAPDVLVKLSPMLDVSATISELGKVTKLYIVEERGEVREVLVHLDRDAISEADTTPIEIVSGDSHFTFTRAEEADATERYAEPVAGYYLYEPSAAVMKAGPFRLLCDKYDVGALHANTHLYVSFRKIDGFPGRRYIIQAVVPYASKNIKRFARDYPAASVSVRNFPCTAAALRAKLKVKESDAVKVVGATLKGGNQVLIVMSRV
ncbi:MAG: class I SAM-dependent methyltransferase [Muribaculaceae bacterium]|nr:class I SAM-dependent methyltransferase [Muribaculaceae bacterium]